MSNKKNPEEDLLQPDVGQKPVQLQRRRVWRACESCRYLKFIRPFYHHNKQLTHHVFVLGARRSSAMDANQRAHNALRRVRNVPGYRLKTELR